MATRQLVIKTGVVKRLVKEVQAYEKETAQLAEKTTKMRDEQADEYDLRQQERIQQDSAKMIPDSVNRLNKAAEELRELMGQQESSLSDSPEYKDADAALNAYYELDGGKHVMEAESEPKDIREDDY